MLSEQGGECAICDEKLDVFTAHIDHCHTTGQVRGLLCKQCNNGLGAFRDRPTLLMRAARYLKTAKFIKLKKPLNTF